MTVDTRFYQLESEMKKKYRTFKIVPKGDSKLMKIIFHGLLMRFWCSGFMERYTTTIVTRVYMPLDLIGSSSGYRVLRHECVHVTDCMKSLILPFLISYVFLLPVVFTLRSVWECRGYKETIRVAHERYGNVPKGTIDFIVSQFTGSSYLWMCPFEKFVRKRFEKFVGKLNGEK